MFMEYQNQRGGNILLRDVSKPRKEIWNTPLEALEDALALEKEVNKVMAYVSFISHMLRKIL